MSRPEELRQITENTRHSLIADESLKFKILQKAASSEQNDMSRQKRIIPAFCTVLAFLLIAVFSLNSIRAVPGSEPGELNSFVAGGSDAAVSLFPEDFDPDSVLSVEMEHVGTISDPDQCHALAQLLLHQSTQADHADPVADGKLIVSGSEGQTYVFQIRDPYLISESGICWSCPGFFSEFSNMIP